MTDLELVVALAIAVGLVGVLVPLLPGSLLVVAAILVWALGTGGTTSVLVAVVAVAFAVTGAVVKYLVPGRRLSTAGVPSRTLWLGALLGVVGFFVVPVIGLPLGFVVGVHLSERARVGHDEAWPATKRAIGAVGLGILIELGFAALAAATWVVGVLVTP